MSNEKPVTCAEVGHCMHPDDTTDTCMRCGDKTSGLDPAIVNAKPAEPDYETNLRDKAALAALQSSYRITSREWSGPQDRSEYAYNVAHTFMTERTKRIKEECSKCTVCGVEIPHSEYMDGKQCKKHQHI